MDAHRHMHRVPKSRKDTQTQTATILLGLLQGWIGRSEPASAGLDLQYRWPKLVRPHRRVINACSNVRITSRSNPLTMRHPQRHVHLPPQHQTIPEPIPAFEPIPESFQNRFPNRFQFSSRFPIRFQSRFRCHSPFPNQGPTLSLARFDSQTDSRVDGALDVHPTAKPSQRDMDVFTGPPRCLLALSLHSQNAGFSPPSASVHVLGTHDDTKPALAAVPLGVS